MIWTSFQHYSSYCHIALVRWWHKSVWNLLTISLTVLIYKVMLILYCPGVPPILPLIKKRQPFSNFKLVHVLFLLSTSWTTRNYYLLPSAIVILVLLSPMVLKSIKSPSQLFNILDYISFSSSSTRSFGIKLQHQFSHNNKVCHFFHSSPSPVKLTPASWPRSVFISNYLTSKNVLLQFPKHFDSSNLYL